MTQLFRVTIPVGNLDEAVQFYRALLGTPGERISPAWHFFQYGSALLACHDAVADGELRAQPPHTEPLFIAVDGNIAQFLVRAQNLGFKHLDPAVSRLPTGETGFRVHDPFGNALCLVDSRTMQWGRSRVVETSVSAADMPVLVFQRDFLNAVKGGELARVKELLALDPDLAETTDSAGVSALMLAAYKRHDRVATHLLGLREELSIWEAAALGARSSLLQLLNKSPQLAYAPAVDGYLPLGLAAYFGQADCVQLLLDRGADANAVSRNAMQARPLHSAVTQAATERALPVVQMLLRAGAEVNIGKSGGYTPLHLAVNRDEDQLVDLLLCFGASMDLRAGDGRSPADIARTRGNAKILALFSAYSAKQASIAA